MKSNNHTAKAGKGGSLSITIGYDAPRRLSALEALREAGVPILPNNLVRSHKRALLKENRLGVWKYLWVIPWGLAWFHRLTIHLTRVANLGIGSILLAGGFLFALVTGLPIIGLPIAFLGIFYLLMICAVEVFLYGNNNRNFFRAQSHWRKVPAGSYHGKIPDQMHRRVNLARAALLEQGINRSRVLVEFLGEDPFLLIQVPVCWVFMRTYRVGAWDTKVPELDYA